MNTYLGGVMKVVYFDRVSTKTMIVLRSSTFGKPIMWSINILSNGLVGMEKGL